MKNISFLFFVTLLVGISCSKDQDLTEPQGQLEERGNDNHKIYKLARVDSRWDYTLTNGFQSDGFLWNEYVYGCSRPVGRVKTGNAYVEENGVTYWDVSFTNTFNDNFEVETEHSMVNGDEILRTFLYDSDYKWIGIKTEINGEVIEDELEIGPTGQVKSYTSDGVRTEYVWKANNVTKINTYVLVSEEAGTIQNSLAHHQLGISEFTRNKASEQIVKKFKELQQLRKTSGSFRSNHSVDEWVLVYVDEFTHDKMVVQPYSSVAAPYPGTCADGGDLALPKNFRTGFKGYYVNEDGSPGEVAYLINYDSYKVKNNLPQSGKYSAFYADYEMDEDGNYLDSNETGTLEWKYISGCNENEMEQVNSGRPTED